MKFTRTTMAQAIASAPWKPGHIAIKGGLDTDTPPYERDPGTAMNAQNFEVNIRNGITRVAGYEKFNGRPAPSDATYTILAATVTGGAVGNTLTGVPSGATGYIIAIEAAAFVLTKVTGTFADADDLQVGGLSKGTATADPVTNGASTALLNAQYNNLAADVYRADIAVPTGSGKILGGFYYGDNCYCFRNNAGATAANLWKEGATGWTAVTLYNEVSFTLGGVTAPAEASTLTQGANTGTIKRVVLTSGSWAAGTAAGRLIVTTPAPGAFAAGAATVGAINLTLSGAQTAITLSPSGRYECIEENFGGSVNSKRIYGCDGVNRGFEFGDDILVPISTGMTTDTPNHVYSHKLHLFFSFGASVQHAGPGTPYIWSLILGAAELAMGDTVTGFAEQAGSTTSGALAIFTRNRLSILYGTSVSDWELVAYRKEIGAWAYTIQDVGFTMFMDDRGITDIHTSQNYGNFAHGVRSNKILSLINSYRPLSISSSICRAKSQYRIFFTNGYGFYVTVSGNKIIGIMPVFFPEVVRCTWNAEDSSGNEVIFFGSDDGFVYQMEKGTSFDGDAIEWIWDESWNFLGSPRVDKSFHGATVEVSSTSYAEFNFGYTLAYGSVMQPQPDLLAATSNFSASTFDSGAVFEAAFFDGTTLSPSIFSMTGMGENCSITIRGSSDYIESFSITGILVYHTPRRQLRA